MSDEQKQRPKAELVAEENRVALEKANEEAADWKAHCSKCGKYLKGTLAELRAHSC